MENRKTDGIILDVDGTLWDSTPIVAKAWTEAVRDQGYGTFQVTAEGLKKLFGKTMMVIAREMLSGLPEEEQRRLMELCCEYEHRELEADPCRICYPGVITTVKQLSGKIPLFIVSNCQSGYIELFLRKTGLEPYVKDIECYGNTGKNKGDNIRLLVERNDLKAPVYVGDTQGDCDASGEAGVPFVFASYGFGTADSWEAKIESFEELTALFG